MKRCASITENDWLNFQWKEAEKLVFSLQRRIDEAIKNKRFNKVKVLQRILTNSLAAKALAVKRVTQNKGKRTAGVDMVLWKTQKQRAEAVNGLSLKGYKPLPLRRIHILKKNGKTRPLGIPSMKDRAMQALYKMALEPISETLADTCSHGFRMYRSCHDAVADIFQKLCRKNSPICILEGDIAGCFDNIAHPWVQENIPINKKVLNAWLKCGFIEKGKLFPTQSGTPQGGIISPLLANMTLDGMQSHIYKALGVKFSPKGRAYNNPFQVYLIRYADDFIVTSNSEEVLKNTVKPAIENFLAERGLQLSAQKTMISTINKGFDFLGFNFRKYKGKLLIKPSKAAIKSFKLKISQIIQRMKSAKTDQLVASLNSVIRGWGYYYRTVVSKEIFTDIDTHIFDRCVRWCRRRHQHKMWYWVKAKYFRRVNNDNWVFSGERRCIFKLHNIQIRRHIKIIGEANPFDAGYLTYFAERRKCKTYSASANKEPKCNFETGDKLYSFM